MGVPVFSCGFYIERERGIFSGFQIQTAKREVNDKGNPETDKPRVIVETNKERQDTGRIKQLHGDEKSRKVWQDGDEQRKDRDEAETVAITIFAIRAIERGEMQMLLPPNVIVRDHDSANLTEQSAVADQPGENVPGRVGHQLPRHHEHADDSGNQSSH